MPMPRRSEKSYNLHIQIPESVMLELEILLHNPLRERRRYGVLTQIIIVALREWIARQKQEYQSNVTATETINPQS